MYPWEHWELQDSLCRILKPIPDCVESGYIKNQGRNFKVTPRSDLSAFYRHGGKIIITVGTMDFIASSGAQLDYYQSLIDKMSRRKTDKFARLYVVPQGGHNLAGKSHDVNGKGEAVPVRNIPAPGINDQIDLIISWVEKGEVPLKTLIINTEGRIGMRPQGKGFLLCSYPNYPRYIGGPADMAASYISAEPGKTR
jgi:feruloyl esterase